MRSAMGLAAERFALVGASATHLAVLLFLAERL